MPIRRARALTWMATLALLASACPDAPEPADPSPAVGVDGASPQDTPIPTADPGDVNRPQITALSAPEDVRPGQIITLRLVTDYRFPEDITGAALIIEGVEGWLLAEAAPTPGTVDDPGAWVVTIPVTVAESFSENAVAKISVALLGPGMLAGAYRNWAPALDEDAPPVSCPADGDCSAQVCGADPICSTDCGSCAPNAACTAEGACAMIGSACPDAADCSGRVCGFDPVCGTDCGSCELGEVCSDAGACESTQDRVVANLSSGATRAHNCALFDDGRVACWGRNDAGQLGLGDLDARGDQGSELGTKLALTDAGALVTQVQAGDAHTCALRDQGELVCWGDGLYGALGRGDILTIGDQPDELPGALVPVALPLAGIEDFCLGDAFGCARDGDGAVACWGRNDFGQLGQGDVEDRGDQTGELGDALMPVDLAGSASALTCGRHHACALVDGDLKCWGRNDWGQLGLGDTEHRGDDPGEMGATLPSVPIGAERSVEVLATGSHHTCVVLDDGEVKCWGQGYWGNLGLESDLVFGDTAETTPAQLPALDLGRDAAVVELALGDRHSCARFDDDEVRCWGYPWALGVGDTEGRGGSPGSMGEQLEAVRLSALPLAGLHVGADFSCARTQSGRLQCWGFNLSGQLGLGDTETRGDEPGEMGPALPFVEL